MIPFPHILLFPLIISFIVYPNCIFQTEGGYSSNGLVDLIKKNVKGALCTVKELGLHPVLNWQEHWLFNWSFLVQKQLMSGMSILL